MSLGCSPHPALQGGGSDQIQLYLELRFEYKGRERNSLRFPEHDCNYRKRHQASVVPETGQKVFKEEFHKAGFLLFHPGLFGMLRLKRLQI